MNETTTEKRAMPESTHSRVNPPTNNRNTDGHRQKYCQPRRVEAQCHRNVISDMSTPTLKENKPHCSYNKGHKSKSEKKSDRQRGHGAKQQQCQSQERVAAEVQPGSGLHQLCYLWKRHNAAVIVSSDFLMEKQTNKRIENKASSTLGSS